MEGSAKELLMGHRWMLSRMLVINARLESLQALAGRQGEARAAQMRMIDALQEELIRIKCSAALYDAVMKCLSELEVRFVQLHYDEGLSFTKIAERELLPGAQTMFANSTLRRMNTAILKKVDEALCPMAQRQAALEQAEKDRLERLRLSRW